MDITLKKSYKISLEVNLSSSLVDPTLLTVVCLVCPSASLMHTVEDNMGPNVIIARPNANAAPSYCPYFVISEACLTKAVANLSSNGSTAFRMKAVLPLGERFVTCWLSRTTFWACRILEKVASERYGFQEVGIVFIIGYGRVMLYWMCVGHI